MISEINNGIKKINSITIELSSSEAGVTSAAFISSLYAGVTSAVDPFSYHLHRQE